MVDQFWWVRSLVDGHLLNPPPLHHPSCWPECCFPICNDSNCRTLLFTLVWVPVSWILWCEQYFVARVPKFVWLFTWCLSAPGYTICLRFWRCLIWMNFCSSFSLNHILTKMAFAVCQYHPSHCLNLFACSARCFEVAFINQVEQKERKKNIIYCSLKILCIVNSTGMICLNEGSVRDCTGRQWIVPAAPLSNYLAK